jgi:hypothetical protein
MQTSIYIIMLAIVSNVCKVAQLCEKRNASRHFIFLKQSNAMPIGKIIARNMHDFVLGLGLD